VRGIRYSAALWRIGREMHRRRVPLAHFHYFHFPPVDALFFKWLHRMGHRIVVTAHDVIPFDATPSGMPWFRRLYSEADRIIVHTEGGRDLLLRQFGIPPERVATIAHGPFLRFADEHRLSREAARRRLGLDERTHVVLFWGQIKRVKGLQDLIRAFAVVAQKRGDALLLIAGPEWKESFDPYLALIGELGLSQRVRARIEYVPDDEVGAYFCSADVVVLPYTDSYQSGVLYMAYSFARPVVATAVGGLAEAVEPDSSGLLVPPGDPVVLADAIGKVLAHPETAEQMGARGRTLAETKFGWAGIAQATVRVYAQALGGTFDAETRRCGDTER
jgi:D-inositol-3-phosphate glycosyltransferase